MFKQEVMPSTAIKYVRWKTVLASGPPSHACAIPNTRQQIWLMSH